MRTLALLLALIPATAVADEIDLSRASPRDRAAAATWIVRAEAGNEFAPFGYVGGCVSYLLDPNDALEVGAGGGFPGLQLGFALHHLFGESELRPFAEIFLAGNTRVNRGRDQSSPIVNAQAAAADSSLWTGLGFGFEQRTGLFSLLAAGNIIFTSTSLTPHWAVHGGIGLGF